MLESQQWLWPPPAKGNSLARVRRRRTHHRSKAAFFAMSFLFSLPLHPRASSAAPEAQCVCPGTLQEPLKGHATGSRPQCITPRQRLLELDRRSVLVLTSRVEVEVEVEVESTTTHPLLWSTTFCGQRCICTERVVSIVCGLPGLPISSSSSPPLFRAVHAIVEAADPGRTTESTCLLGLYPPLPLGLGPLPPKILKPLLPGGR